MVVLDTSKPPAEIDSIANAILGPVAHWYEGHRKKTGSIDSNVMCAGMYVTEFLASAFPLTREVYAAKSQVKAASGAKARALLKDHGEHRQFTKEGGRTSRATIRHAETLADLINSIGGQHGVASLTQLERRLLAALLQRWFVIRVQEDYFKKQNISVEIDQNNSIHATVARILEAGRQRGGTAAGAIAQHLVGAKLQLRFPAEEINSESYTTADVQTGRAGDFQVRDTAIHVTMSPTESLFRERCKHNIDQGFRSRVLVPEDKRAAAVQLAGLAFLEERVAIQSIEDFVGTNIEEIAIFSKNELGSQLRKLLESYNMRIQKAEADQSLKIDIPENL